MNRLIRWASGVAAALTAGAAIAVTCEDPNPLRFALIPRTDLVKQMQSHRPLLKHLEKLLGRKIAIIQPTSYGTVIEGLVSGSIDLASMGPASYAIAKNRDPSITAFATWTMQGGTYVQAGSHTYNSLLVTREDSGLKTIAQLKGRSVSLTDPASTSGAVIPREEFSATTGARLEDYFGRVTYSGSHDRSIEGVRKGFSDAAFVASEHLDEMIRNGTIDARELRLLWRSHSIPHDPFVYRGKLCAALRDKIRQSFLTESREMAAMLINLKGERFYAIDDDEYRYIRNILTRDVR